MGRGGKVAWGKVKGEKRIWAVCFTTMVHTMGIMAEGGFLTKIEWWRCRWVGGFFFQWGGLGGFLGCEC